MRCLRAGCWKQRCLALSAVCLGADALPFSAADTACDGAHPLFTRRDRSGSSRVSSFALFVDRGNTTDENAPSFEDSSLFEVLME